MIMHTAARDLESKVQMLSLDRWHSAQIAASCDRHAVRTYQCRNCGLMIDRKLNSAINILNTGVPAEHREFTPVDTKASIEMIGYFNSIPNVLASIVVETGSPSAFSRG